MTEGEIYSVLNDVVGDVLGHDVTLSATTTAQDVKGWDSVNHVAIAVAIEMRLGIKFRSGEMEDLKNVDDMVALIKRKRDAKR